MITVTEAIEIAESNGAFARWDDQIKTIFIIYLDMTMYVFPASLKLAEPKQFDAYLKVMFDSINNDFLNYGTPVLH